MDFDLGSREKKIQKEREKRKEEARQRILKEKREKEAAAQRQAEIERQLKQKRLDQQLKEEQEQRNIEDEERLTGGIKYTAHLHPRIRPGNDDKITLPSSALEELARQDATSMGPMLFELTVEKMPSADTVSAESIRVTHCGVLEFTAEEGETGLPIKVLRSLGLNVDVESISSTEDDNEADENLEVQESASGASHPLVGAIVRVKYVRLPKATYARVVPALAGLSQVSELRVMLEENLRHHATLTQGDWLQVWHRGKRFELRVEEVKPSPRTTIIDTELTLDLALPTSVAAVVDAQAAADRARTIRGDIPMQDAYTSAVGAGSILGGTGSILGGSGSILGGSVVGSAKATSSDMSDDSESEGEEVFDIEAHRESMWKRLPQEPAEGEANVVTCKIRSRSSVASRRFRWADKLQSLFDFCEAAVPSATPGTYRLASAYPRSQFDRDSGERSFEEAGLAGKQVVLQVEAI